MKKLLALLLAMTMLLTLAACGGNGNSGIENQTDNNSAAADSEAGPDQSAGEDQAESPAEEPEEVPEETEEPETEADSAEEETETAWGDAEIPEAEAVGASHSDVTFSAAGSSFRLVPTGDTENITGVAYASADEAVATVGEDGTVTAVAPGTTTVTMTLTEGREDYSFDCIIRCSWQETESPAEGEADSGEDGGETAASVQSLADFYAGLQESFEGLGMMMTYEGELLDNYYPGLSDIAVEEILIQETAMTMANCAVALVHVTDSADAAAVEAILAARAQIQADGGAWYPASCETWANAVIVTEGNYVGMFVYPETAQDMADAFTAAYGG